MINDEIQFHSHHKGSIHKPSLLFNSFIIPIASSCNLLSTDLYSSCMIPIALYRPISQALLFVSLKNITGLHPIGPSGRQQVPSVSASSSLLWIHKKQSRLKLINSAAGLLSHINLTSESVSHSSLRSFFKFHKSYIRYH